MKKADNKQNPFTLTFGKLPDSFIERYENTNKIIDTFNNTSVSQTYLIEGIRGSGKTVLMTHIAKELSKSEEWVIVNLNSTQDLLEDLALRLSDICETTPNLLEQGFNITIAGFGLGVNGKNETVNNVSIIKRILTGLKNKKKKILITIDEVMQNQNMRVFASEFQILLREDYPVYLIMTGLHKNIHDIQNDPALTFLLRSPKIKLGPLSIFQITKNYRSIFELADDEADKLAGITKGYAFAYQALGAIYWDNQDNPDMDTILETFDNMLDDFVYNKIWETCTKKDKEFLMAVTHDDTSTKEICNSAKMKLNSYSKYRDKLMQQELIVSGQHGYISLALPRFYEIARNYKI